MNLDLFKSTLINETTSSFSWKENEQEHGVNLSATLYYLKKSIGVNVRLYEDGALFVSFNVDPIKESLEAYKLVNYFNANSNFLHAYIHSRRNSNDLFVEYSDFNVVDENHAKDMVIKCFDEITSDGLRQYLKPIVLITTCEEE